MVIIVIELYCGRIVARGIYSCVEGHVKIWCWLIIVNRDVIIVSGFGRKQ